jgi:hypothetical protein
MEAPAQGARSEKVPLTFQDRGWEATGRIGSSDTPNVGTRVIDVTPTQGADEMTGRSVKGEAVAHKPAQHSPL